MELDTSDFHQKIEEVLKSGKKELESARTNERQLKDEKEKKIKAEALAILNQILEEIKSQSRRGLSYLVVMPLYKNKDYLGSDFEEISHRRKKSRLTGKGKIVFDECKKAGLDPKIDYCSNRDPRFRIIISW